MRLATVTDSLLAELRITEIFFSLQGEARTVGLPTVFIRLTGCPLRCSYCDTTYSFTGGEKYTLTAIMQQVADYGAKYVCVTGGEPLAQPNCLPLLTALCDAGYQVSLETSGALDVSQVDRRVSKVVDLKTPDSGEAHRNLYENMQHLTANDQIKFVICSRQDYQWAKFKIDEYQLNQRVSDVLLSPSHQQQDPRELAEWILADKLAVRLQVQLHKYLWNNEAGH
ncbi:MAG TPA: 7-carboxy-7-deazaguanine synthase QueE [Agitococcus sp.]|nr:7-carboxy-7-deazaguanine synthase QueE [Agitococcus sp.]HMX98280.1 7-carboxy-7-deazaguanine synthase QueE [Agitococcus sp.]HMY81252.1 7-carboxy-7-deazaguanine synthase QueE [Agitococcus sp.]HNC01759.1 7-carboxy-7-deazaguanine synthase QueE [Agitococcus sp.]HNC85309.1 7-carboxy-7-deazaguanine synthase QueE [Agitococcus sp.]